MFKDIIERLPLPAAGILLALFSLGNLHKENAPMLRYALAIAAIVILLALVVKVIFSREAVSKELENPVVVSVLSTISMGLLISVTYLVELSKTAATALWFAGVILHIGFMIFYIMRVLIPFNIKKIFPTIFIPFVGIVCATVSSPAVGQQALGQTLFWFGIVAFIVCLPIALYRVFGGIEIPAPARPTVMIFAAPSALLLAGYLQAFDAKMPWMVIALGICVVVFLTLALYLAWPAFKSPFTPSHSAFTFPLVICAIAMAGTGKFFAAQGFTCPVMPYLAPIFLVLAWAGVLYAIVRYAVFLAGTQNKAGNSQKMGILTKS